MAGPVPCGSFLAYLHGWFIHGLILTGVILACQL
jgi:hypothetical protein